MAGSMRGTYFAELSRGTTVAMQSRQSHTYCFIMFLFVWQLGQEASRHRPNFMDSQERMAFQGSVTIPGRSHARQRLCALFLLPCP